jgi:ribulose-5-phosphate 4-epimerase/fuculose-1-phosphate aldolase
MPLSQFALTVINKIAYHDYEGIALNLDERERLVADLGDKPLMILRNHGTLGLGATAGDCFRAMYTLEQACKVQIHALAAGRDRVLIAPSAAQEVVREQTRRGVGGALPWPGLLRRLDRLSPGYDA